MADQKKALLSEIRANPDDLVSRLVYADWLEENGDPLAELIRVQCELAELPADSPEASSLALREKDLLAEYHEQWVQPLKDRFGAIGVVVKNGFVDSLRITADTFLDNADEIVEMLPALCSLTLGRPRDRLRDLAATPALKQVPGLDLRGGSIGDEGLAVLLSSPHLANLVHLSLSGNKLSPEAAARLASAEPLKNLRSLDLSRNPIGGDGLARLGESTVLNQVQSLDSRSCEVRLMGFERFCAATGMPKLRHVNLAQNSMGEMARQHLEFTRPLETLRLWDTQIHVDSLSVIANSPAFAQLRLLDISDNGLATAPLARCLHQKFLPSLRSFVAMRNVFGTDSQQKNFDFPELIQIGDKPIHYLNLSLNRLSDRCFQQLGESGCLRKAQTLCFNQTGIDLPGLREVLKSTTQLSRLSVFIHGNHTRPRKVPLARLLRELASWPGLARLKYLEVGDSVLSDTKGFGQLLNSPHRNSLMRIVSHYDSSGDRMKISHDLEKKFGLEGNIVHWA